MTKLVEIISLDPSLNGNIPVKFVESPTVSNIHQARFVRVENSLQCQDCTERQFCTDATLHISESEYQQIKVCSVPPEIRNHICPFLNPIKTRLFHFRGS